MKLIYKFLKLTPLLGLLVLFTGCLEDDGFDGLTDVRPEVSITFPGRDFDQNGGLAFIHTGMSNDPLLTVNIELEGGSADMTNISSVEARAAHVNIGICGSFAVVDIDVPVSGRTTTYQIQFSALANSAATCSPILLIPDMYFEMIFTIDLNDGRELISQKVRVMVKQ